MLFTPPENNDNGGNDSDTIMLQQHKKFETLIYLKIFPFLLVFFFLQLRFFSVSLT